MKLQKRNICYVSLLTMAVCGPVGAAGAPQAATGKELGGSRLSMLDGDLSLAPGIDPLVALEPGNHTHTNDDSCCFGNRHNHDNVDTGVKAGNIKESSFVV